MAAARPLSWPHTIPPVPVAAALDTLGRTLDRALRTCARWLARLPWADLLAHGVFLAAAGILFFAALTRGAIRWQDDTKYFYFPLLSQVAGSLKQGHLPLWEPGIFGGYPLLADGESGMLYPPHLVLLRLLDPAVAIVALRVLRFVLAGSFTFTFLRAVGARRTGAVVSGLAFMLSSFMVGQVVHENLDSGMIWLPLVLCFCERALRQTPAQPGFRRRRYVYATMAGVALAMQALAVHVQVVVFTVLLVFPYLGWRLFFRDAIGARLPGRLLIGTGIGTIVALIGAGLSAAQMLPLLAAADESARGHGISASAATINSVTPFQLLTGLFPHLLRLPSGATSTYWVEWEVAVYVGIPTLLFAIAALAFRRDRYVVFFAGAAVLSLVLTLGRYGPPWVVLITEDLLGDHGLRSPGRFSFLWSFSAAVLAGLGVDALDRRPYLRSLASRLWALVVCAVLATFAGALLIAARVARTWLLAHPDQARAWLDQHYINFDRAPVARLSVTADDVYRGLAFALDPRNPATVLWAVSIVLGYGVLIAWLVVRHRWRRVVLRPLTVLAIALPLLGMAASVHPEATAAAALEPDSGAARYLRDHLAPAGVPADARPLYRVYTSQPVYLGHTGVEPNILLPTGVQEAGGYSSLSTTINLAYGWAAETSMGTMLDVWNARYFLWPNTPNPLPSYELTSFHPQRPLLSGSGYNAGATASFRVPSVLGENVRVIATLRDAWRIPAGTTVAWITATDTDGVDHRWPLRMGQEIAEATAPPASPAAPASPVAPADASADDAGGSQPAAPPAPQPLPIFSWKEYAPDGHPFDVWLYYAKLPLDAPRTITRLTVQTVPLPDVPEATLHVHGLGVGMPDWQVANVVWSDRGRFSLVYQGSEIRIYRNETALPRAYLIPLAVSAPAAGHIKEMADRSFDPVRMLLVDPATGGAGGAGDAGRPLEGPSEPLGAGGWLASADPATDASTGVVQVDESGRTSDSPAGKTTLVRYAGEDVVARVDARTSAWLFLADTYHPAWRAYVDGKPVPLRLANAMFRAVAVPAGQHTVEFRYEPAPLQQGATISLITGVLVLALFTGSACLRMISRSVSPWA